MSSGAIVNAEAGGNQAAKRPVPQGFASLTEGQATILQRGNEVFYNPAQVVNRDLSIAVLNYFSKHRFENMPKQNRKAQKSNTREFRILEGLAASGLRSIRYALEIEGVTKVVSNDMDPSVARAIQRNVDFNGPRASSLVTPSTGDARLVMLQNPDAFEAVDLDPYGSPTQLLDSAVQAVSDGGLLCVTATDMAVLCGNNSETCYAKYGSYPLHKPYCHEMAVRILLGAIDTHAARYKRYIVPVLSCSIDFYVRVFVRVFTSAEVVKSTGTKHGYVYQSQGCDSFTWQRVGRKMLKGNSIKFSAAAGPAVPEKCPETGSGYTMGGPFWAEPIHDPEWVKGILESVKTRQPRYQAHDRLIGLLTLCSEELGDCPLYLNLHDVCKTLHCSAPRAEIFKSALLNAGFRVSGTHCTPLGIKTDAPWSAIWDIMRCWIIDHPIKPHPEGSYVANLLAKEPELKADFSRVAQAMPAKKKVAKGKKKVPRFLPNPEQNWGPKPKHGRVLKEEYMQKPHARNKSGLEVGNTSNGHEEQQQQPVVAVAADDAGYDSTMS